MTTKPFKSLSANGCIITPFPKFSNLTFRKIKKDFYIRWKIKTALENNDKYGIVISKNKNEAKILFLDIFENFTVTPDSMVIEQDFRRVGSDEVKLYLEKILKDKSKNQGIAHLQNQFVKKLSGLAF